MRSSFEVIWQALTSYCLPVVFVWTGRLSGGVLGFSGRIHNVFKGSYIPFRTFLLLYRIKNLYLSYYTLQAVFHKIFMDTEEVLDRPGTTFSCVAALGIHGRSKFPVCVHCSLLPSGRCMTRGWVAGFIFLSGSPGKIKLSVSPASTLAWLISIFIWMC